MATTDSDIRSDESECKSETDSKSDDMECNPDTGKEVLNFVGPPPPEPLPCEERTFEQNELLPPDHPLLARFQETLREHLLRVKHQLAEDIDDIRHQIKIKQAEREEYGVKLYDMQDEISKQNNLLEEYSQNITATVAKRIDEERKCHDLRHAYDEKLIDVNARKSSYKQHVLELNHLADLETNIRRWTEEFEGELITSKRIVSKDMVVQKANAQEKQKLDLMSFNLESEVKKREEELAGIQDQIVEQKRINDLLHNSLADANADLESLQQEQKHLSQAWGEVIVAITHRDRILFQVKQRLANQEESLKLTKASIQATIKQRSKETDENTKLRNFKQHLERDLVKLKRDSGRNEMILEKLEQTMEELPLIIDQTEKDFKEAKKEGYKLNIELNSLQFKVDRLNVIKVRFEDAILRLAQDQLLCDKAGLYRIKVLEQNQQTRRNMDINLEKVRKQLSNILVQLERQRNVILHVEEQRNTLAATMKQRNNELDGTNDEIKVIDNDISLKMKQMEKLASILDTMLKDSQGIEMSPTEYKIKLMEKAVADTDQKVQEHQQFWLILQGHIVHLHEKRHCQLNDIQVSRKQLMIVNQKTLKIDMEIEKREASADGINREIENCSTKLELLSAKCYEEKKQHELTEFDCNMEHAELLNKLKDYEIKVLELEQEIIDLQNEAECYKEEVLELHREALSWETKYKMLDDIVRWRRKERATDSDIGNMRAEIHRMQIRHKELRRAQEKLIQDLDHCVMHRETIFINASRQQKMEGNNFRSRTNIQQRINDAKIKLKQTRIEIQAAEKKVNNLCTEHNELILTTRKLEEQYHEDMKLSKQIENEIEQGILLKQQNLENIVRKQYRAKEYRRLASCTSLSTRSIKSEATIENNIKKQAEINQKLLDMIESLLNDFPEKSFSLTRIGQTLRD